MIEINELKDLIDVLKNGVITLKVKNKKIVEIDYKQKITDKKFIEMLKLKDKSDII